MKNLKYFIFLFIVILITCGKVTAAVSPYLNTITFPTNYRVYNLTSSSNADSIYFGNSCHNNDSSVYDLCYTTWDGTFATYGYGLNIQTTTSFINNFYYGVTYYFGSNSQHLYSPEYSNYGVKNSVGSGWNGQTASNIISWTTNGCLDLGDKYNPHVYGYRYLCSYNQVFQAKTNGYYLWSVFNSSTKGKFYEEDFAFIGYSIALNGSGATSVSEIKSALSNEFNDLTNNINNSTTIINNNINSVKEQQNETNNKLDDVKSSIDSDDNDTTSKKCGIVCKLKGIFTGIVNLPGKIVSGLIDALKSLFIPSDTSFITDFVESIENKLGFIAEIPISIINFGLELVTTEWDKFDSVTFPSISIFGYNFWNTQEVDLTEAINIFKPYKYITDILCVIICAATLKRWREKFNGGGE